MNLPLRKSLADRYINEYGAQIDSMLNSTDFSLESIISKLNSQIQNLESMALQAYSALGYSGNDLQSIEAQINQDIQILQQDVKVLNGLNLQSVFLDSLKTTTFNFDLSSMYDNLFAYAKQQVQNQKGPTIEVAEEEALSEVLSIIGMGSGGGITISKDMIYMKGTRGALGKYGSTFSELGEKLKAKIADWMIKNNVQYNLSTDQGSNYLNMTWILNNFSTESLLKMKKADREILFRAHPALQQVVNDNFKNKIIQNCPLSDTNTLSNVIDRILNSKPDAFWGATDRNMTGILGEIQAGYFLDKIIGAKGGSSSYDWVGGRNGHADYMLKQALEQYGIQVKNTSLETAQAIEFKKFGFKKDGQSSIHNGLSFDFTDFAKTSFSNMVGGFSSDSSKMMEAVSTVLGMDTFNIEYQWIDGMAQPNANPIFAPTRQLIEAYATKAEQLMSLFAVSLMYMQTANIDTPEANTLYLVAGTTVISSASILSKIVSQLEQKLRDFRFQVQIGAMKVADKKAFSVAPGTIVNYFNAQIGYHHNLQIALQSSYTFK